MMSQNSTPSQKKIDLVTRLVTAPFKEDIPKQHLVDLCITLWLLLGPPDGYPRHADFGAAMQQYAKKFTQQYPEINTTPSRDALQEDLHKTINTIGGGFFLTYFTNASDTPDRVSLIMAISDFGRDIDRHYKALQEISTLEDPSTSHVMHVIYPI